MNVEFLALEGGCSCGELRYRLAGKPLIVHCCHCRWCQRESGSAFALNAMIETDRLKLLQGRPLLETIPSFSGKGQDVARCPECMIALWSHYASGGATFAYVRVGTLDAPDSLPPDIHIFTASKQPWVVLPAGTPAVPEFYRRSEVWSAESQERRRIALEGPAGG
jgi:hypothetical protein